MTLAQAKDVLSEEVELYLPLTSTITHSKPSKRTVRPRRNDTAGLTLRFTRLILLNIHLILISSRRLHGVPSRKSVSRGPTAFCLSQEIGSLTKCSTARKRASSISRPSLTAQSFSNPVSVGLLPRQAHCTKQLDIGDDTSGIDAPNLPQILTDLAYYLGAC